MVAKNSPVGRCPACGATIAPYDVIIEYDTDEGRDMFAGCGECGEVVTPER